MNVSKRVCCIALLIAGASVPAVASVKDGVDAWSRGDYDKAVAEWEKPAAAGDADAQFNLGQAYKLGKGVPADLKRAEELYRQAADQGHLQAADMYGLLLFQSGRREQAMAWLVPSAERGEPRAQYVLGIAHFNGDLVPKDPVRAYALMTRAAASGLETAKGTLGAMDRALPLEQRQQGVALGAELEAKAAASRATQLAAVGLGDKGKPAPRVAVTPLAVKPAPTLKSEPVTAGADYAKPVVLASPTAKPTVTHKPIVPAPKPPPSPSPSPVAAGNWLVQLGAFGVASNAQAMWAKVKDHTALSGRQAFFVPAGKLIRLQAGPFATRAEAQAACAKLSGQACIPVLN